MQLFHEAHVHRLPRNEQLNLVFADSVLIVAYGELTIQYHKAHHTDLQVLTNVVSRNLMTYSRNAVISPREMCPARVKSTLFASSSNTVIYELPQKAFEGCCIPEEWQQHVKDRLRELNHQLHSWTAPRSLEDLQLKDGAAQGERNSIVESRKAEIAKRYSTHPRQRLVSPALSSTAPNKPHIVNFRCTPPPLTVRVKSCRPPQRAANHWIPPRLRLFSQGSQGGGQTQHSPKASPKTCIMKSFPSRLHNFTIANTNEATRARPPSSSQKRPATTRAYNY